MATARVCLLSCVLLLAGVVPTLLLGSAARVSIPAGSTPVSDFNAKSVHVYVSLFDINAAQDKPPVAIARAPAPQKAQPGARPSAESPRVLPEGDSNSKQADRLKAFFDEELVQALRKNGFNAAPLGNSRPEKGVLLKGVFAEVDSQNHNCLAILGGATSAPSFLLYVGVYNLAKPDQPLYRVMTMETCDAHYGPVISLNSYIPMEKYELSKSPAEDEVRKVCARVVADLRALLSVNTAAFSG